MRYTFNLYLSLCRPVHRLLFHRGIHWIQLALSPGPFSAFQLMLCAEKRGNMQHWKAGNGPRDEARTPLATIHFWYNSNTQCFLTWYYYPSQTSHTLNWVNMTSCGKAPLPSPAYTHRPALYNVYSVGLPCLSSVIWRSLKHELRVVLQLHAKQVLPSLLYVNVLLVGVVHLNHGSINLIKTSLYLHLGNQK